MFGWTPHGDTSYLAKGRLADVLSLIQVLAQHQDAHRSEAGLELELQGKPQSGCSWPCIAKDHPEFFRVRKDAEHQIALLARHALPRDAKDRRPPLSDDYTHNLLSTAIELHDRQLKYAENWVPLVPMWTASLTAFVALLAAIIAAGAAIWSALMKH